MKDQINTIRAAVDLCLLVNPEKAEQALTALTQLEAMVGAQEPVAWMANFTNRYGNADVYVTTHKHLAIENDEHGTPRPLVFGDAAPVGQQHVPEADCGNITPAELAKRIERGEKWEVAQQPLAEPTDSMGIPLSCGKPLCSPGDHHPLCRLHKQPQAEVVWVNPELEHMAEEAECVSMCLNDRGVPSKDGSKPLSLWGRVQQYANPRFLEGMTTNTPIISSEHIKALAQVCRLIGNYTTAEFVQNVVGFAQVLLANKAVQEAFVKANAHLLYAAPQQAEAVPPDVVRNADVEAAAKKMAEIFDYPWDFMPEKGRNTMRENVRAVLDAAIAQQKGGV